MKVSLLKFAIGVVILGFTLAGCGCPVRHPEGACEIPNMNSASCCTKLQNEINKLKLEFNALKTQIKKFQQEAKKAGESAKKAMEAANRAEEAAKRAETAAAKCERIFEKGLRK